MADDQNPDVRFSLANERTLLAYQRTAIGLMAAAIAVVHFFGDDVLVLRAAPLVLLVTGAFAAVGGYLQLPPASMRRIREGRPIGSGPAAHRSAWRCCCASLLAGGVRLHRGRLSVPPSSAFCVDVGSTFTKAALVDDETGALLGTASHRTTLDTDVLDGVDACRADLADAHPAAADAEVLACSSAGGGLRIAVVGNEELVTAEAGRRVALSSGGKVVAVLGRRARRRRLAELRAARPGRAAAGRRDRRRQRGGRSRRRRCPGAAGPAPWWSPATSRRRMRSRLRSGSRRRTCSPTTWCRGSACSRRTLRGARSARCSSRT